MATEGPGADLYAISWCSSNMECLWTPSFHLLYLSTCTVRLFVSSPKIAFIIAYKSRRCDPRTKLEVIVTVRQIFAIVLSLSSINKFSHKLIRVLNLCFCLWWLDLISIFYSLLYPLYIQTRQNGIGSVPMR